MTAPAQTPPVAFGTLPEAIEAVRRGGLRLSTARRLVLESLFAAQSPRSAGQLAEELLLDESSIYRNLEVLERHGLIRHFHLGHGPGLYTLVGRQELEYLYCERCARATAVEPKRLDAVRDLIAAEFGHQARFTHFPIVGLCAACAGPDPHPPGADGEPSDL